MTTTQTKRTRRIEPGVMYDAAALREDAGIGSDALLLLRRDHGLPHYYAGKCVMFLGSEVIEAIKHSRAKHSEKSSQEETQQDAA